MEKNNSKVSLKQKFSYGLLNYPFVLVETLVATFLMFFYTDVAGISPGIIGTMFLAATIWDAINDYLVGLLVDNTNTKWGKARPFVLWSAVPLLVFLILVAYSPDVGNTLKIVYAYVTFICLGMSRTLLQISFMALLPLMSSDRVQRGDVASFSIALAGILNILVVALFMPLVNILGGGNMGKGYILTMIILASVGFVIQMIGFFTIKENVVSKKRNKISLKDSLKTIVKVKPFYYLFSNIFFRGVVMTILMANGLYYCRYVLENKNLVTVFQLLVIGGMLAMQFVVPVLNRKMSTRKLGILGGIVLAVIGFVRFFITGVMIPEYITLFLFGAGLVIFNNIHLALNADSCDYAEWKRGKKIEGVVSASGTYAAKLGVAIGSWVLATVLGKTNYIADGIQNAATILAIKFNYSIIIGIMGIAYIILYSTYKLETTEYPIMRESLKQSRK